LHYYGPPMGTLFLSRMPPFLMSAQQRTATRVQTYAGCTTTDRGCVAPPKFTEW
jgi:hypothetical protein